MKQNVKKFIATSGLVTAMVLGRSNISAAQAIPDISAMEQRASSRQSFRHEKRFENKLSHLAAKAGIDPEVLRSADSRTTIKQLLKDHGITNRELQQIFGNRHGRARNGRSK